MLHRGIRFPQTHAAAARLQASTLRRIQAAAAAPWVLYGIAIHSAPVVVANLTVGIAAV